MTYREIEEQSDKRVSAQKSAKSSLPQSSQCQGEGTFVRKRDVGIDVARGLAIIFVVIGHNTALATLFPSLIEFLFLFHVPVFFFLTGYLLRPDTVGVKRVGIRILLPFALVGLSLAVVKALVRGTDLSSSVLGVLWGTGATLSSSQLWFLPALFITVLATKLLADVCRFRLFRITVGFAVLMVLSVYGLHALSPPLDVLRRADVPGPLGWFWSIDLLPIASVYCFAGYLSRNLLDIRGVPSWFVLPLLLLTLLCHVLGARTDLNMRLMEPFGLALIAAFLGIGGVLIGARWIGKRFRDRTRLADIGKHTMAILLFHVQVQNLVLSVWAGTVTGTATHLIAGVVGVVGVVAGVAIPIALSNLTHSLWEKHLVVGRKLLH